MGVITVIKIILFRHRGVLCFNWPLLLYLCSFWSTAWNRSHRKWPCRLSCQRRQIIPLTKKQAVFLSVFFSFCVVVFVSPLMYRTGLFLKAVTWVIERGWKDGPRFRDLRCLHKPLRSGEISQEVCGIPARWASGPPFPVFRPCWKFRENSAWMKTRSIFTFPLKRVSVLSSSQAYHLPLQTHLEISLATRRRNMQKISEVEDHVDSNASSRKSEDVVLFCGVCKVKHHFYFYCVPCKRFLFSF